MYEHLESLRQEHAQLLESLTPRSDSEIEAVSDAHPSCPDEYLHSLLSVVQGR